MTKPNRRSPSLLRAETIEIAGQIIPLRLRHNPRARRIIVRVDTVTGEVIVTTPTKKGAERALAFARREADWIAEKLAALAPLQPFIDGAQIPVQGVPHVIRHVPEARRGVWLEPACSAGGEAALMVSGGREFLARRIRDWLKQHARDVLSERVRVHAETLDLEPGRITVRDQATRWGSCAANGALSFSWRLILAPPAVLDYVAAHEVAHLREMNHGPRFWRLVLSVCPSAREHERWLSESGAKLHRYGV